jgi:hypothetical protein
MYHVVGPLHILLAEKEGKIWFNIICLKLYQFERITLVVFVCLGIYHGIRYEIFPIICPEICHAENFIKKVIVS